MSSAYFEYKGVNSLDMHLRIQNEISFPSPEVDIEFVEVLGRDGELAVNNNRLKGVDFSFPVILHLPPNRTINEVSTQISNWLKSEVGWYPLRFSGSPDYEYLALFYEQYNVAETLKTYGKTVLTCRLKPYKRHPNSTKMEINNGQSLYNPETRTAKPLIRIVGNGNFVFKNNGKEWLILEGVDGEITIDSEAMSVYKGNQPQFLKMKGNLVPLFPVLESGSNHITWTGSASKVEIDVRWEAIV